MRRSHDEEEYLSDMSESCAETKTDNDYDSDNDSDNDSEEEDAPTPEGRKLSTTKPVRNQKRSKPPRKDDAPGDGLQSLTPSDSENEVPKRAAGMKRNKVCR
eukprot:GHVN01048371.1.p2 GENE.GHVN01048371.1~~GHVN01048371.1.p2  ORF type:complete len:102 (-),score=17.96 GHVN01048371.1:3182-3487(-)